MSYQPISGVTLVCMSASAAISALSLFHGEQREEEEEEWEDSNLSLSLSNGNANVHPSEGREGGQGMCEEERSGGYFTEKGRQIGGVTGWSNRISTVNFAFFLELQCIINP